MWDALREIPSSELQPVVDYLLREKICCDELAARTKAREDYRCNGILRNRTFTPAQQHKKWEEATKKWEEVFNKAQSSNPKERCVIRKKTELVQGTLDQMKTMEACILKGCMEQPFDWQEMWLNTRIQPVTGLQERLSIGDTSRNEARHCALNQLVQNISHMNEDLMEVLLDFEIYFTNMRFDVLLGRVDAHSLTCFSWEVSELNSHTGRVVYRILEGIETCRVPMKVNVKGTRGLLHACAVGALEYPQSCIKKRAAAHAPS